jgi:hypothetical protein
MMSEPTPPWSSPAAAAASVQVVVRGLDGTCWKCRQPTTCVVAVHDAGAERSDDWVWFEDKHALAFARELLLRAGQAGFGGTIKPRVSRTGGGAYLSNGCEHCDAIQGDWPIGRVILEYGVAAPLSELLILATVPVERTVWEELVARQSMRRFGYPMRCEDLA